MIVSLSGGLGNQMFQYAFGRCVSFARREELFFDKSSFDYDPLRHYELNAYNLNLQFAHPVAPFYDEPDLTFHPEVYDVMPGTTFRGYWQTEKYMNRSTICGDFFIPRGLPNKACGEMADRIIHEPESCFVGVRRGDYLWPERINYHGVLPVRYYIDAERRMPHNAKYFVFTDDIPWCRQNLREDWEIVDVNGPDEKHWDIWLMNMCKHAIIANSTFHWFGAWLTHYHADGIIVSPANWFVNGIPNEVVPDRWTKI